MIILMLLTSASSKKRRIIFVLRYLARVRLLTKRAE